MPVDGVVCVTGVRILGIVRVVGMVENQAVLDELGETALHLEQRDAA